MNAGPHSRPPPARPTGSAFAAFGVGVFFLVAASITRLGLHDEVNAFTVAIWLVLGAFATWLSLAVWRPRLPGVRTMLRRSVVLITAAGWALGAVVVFGPPHDPHDRDERYQGRCRFQLEGLGDFLQIYAENNAGRYPDRPEALLPVGAAPAAFVCPSTRLKPATGATPADVADAFAGGGHNAYVYAAKGLTLATTRPDSVLLYEPPTNHVRDHPGLHVLYAGDRVEFLQGDAADQFIYDMRRREAAAARPHTP